jgi:hypothetical protein
MSLYDKASLIFSGAAGAGNEEVAYNIKPVEKLKVDELITNNKLLTSDGWSFSDSNITVASGKIVFNNAAQYATARWDTDVFEEGKTYKVSFKVEDFKGGASNSKLLAQQANNTQIDTEIDRDGNYSFYYTPGAPDGTTHQNKFQLKTVTTSLEAKVSDFSIKEVEQKANDFSFVRASDLTATYEDPDGLIKKTRENLIEYSNDFSEWSAGSGASANYNAATTGHSGYDGSTDAWLIDKVTDENSYSAIPNPFAYTGVFTWSIYARNKSDKDNGIHLYTPAGQIKVDLTDGSRISGIHIDYDITPITGSSGDNDRWYRISFSANGSFSVSDPPRIKVVDLNGDNDTGAVYVQDSQLEQGLVATPYIDRTGAAYSTAGIREDEPRYDYSLDNALPPALLYEPERTNKFIHSEYLASSSIFKTNSSFTTNQGTSPEGLNNAAKMNEGTASGNLPHNFYYSGIQNSKTYTISFYAKKIDRDHVYVNIYSGVDSKFVFYDLSDGTVATSSLGDVTASIYDAGSGWYRISYTRDTAATGSPNFRIGMSSANGTVDYQGNGSETLFYGVQWEEGSCVTSYIPTYGSAGTREADLIPQYTPSKTNLDKYTFFAHSHSDRVTSDNRAPRLKGDGNSALMGIFVNASGKKQFFLYDNENNSKLSKATFGSFEADDDTKYAFVVDNIALEAKLFIDGVLRETISLTERVDAKIISVGNSDGNPDRIKSIMYFPEALEDADVVSLTT